MKTPRQPRLSLTAQLGQLQVRLTEAQETLRAIRSGEVDAVVVSAPAGAHVYTLEGANDAYRVLIESMNEGALTVTLTTEKLILYANQCFARMVKCPLEQVIGSSFHRFLSPEDQKALRALLKGGDPTGAKIQVSLRGRGMGGAQLPVQLSVRRLAKTRRQPALMGMVLTDLTEARRNEVSLRALSHRLVHAHEIERGRVARQLHDHITQLLCAVLVRSEVLAKTIAATNPAAKREAIQMRKMLGHIAEEVERISRNLRPSVLDELGLDAALRDTCTQFSAGTGVPVKLAFVQLSIRLPADSELAFFRILQESLKNVEKHARAGSVAVRFRKRGAFIELAIKDDGIGFDAERHSSLSKAKRGLGLLSMRERAAYLGGSFKLVSIPKRGTAIQVRIPLSTG